MWHANDSTIICIYDNTQYLLLVKQILCLIIILKYPIQEKYIKINLSNKSFELILVKILLLFKSSEINKSNLFYLLEKIYMNRWFTYTNIKNNRKE